MGLSRTPLRLFVLYPFDLEAKLRHYPAKEGRRVVEIPKDLYEILVIKPGAREMLDLLHIRKLLYEFVIKGAKVINNRIFLALCLYPDDYLIALLPFLQVFRDEVERILKITDHSDRAVARGLEHAMKRGIELPEILGVEDGLDLFVLPAYLAEERTGVVRRGVVYE